MAHFDGRNAVLLDWSWDFVSTELNIAKHCRVQPCRLKGIHGLNTLDALLSDIDLSDPRGFMSVTKPKIDEGFPTL